jgi:hypothetical protein
MTSAHSLRVGFRRFRVVVLAGFVIPWAVVPVLAGQAPQADDASAPQLTRAVQQAVANAFPKPEPMTAWQLEVAAAKARRSAGRKQMAFGYGLAIVGDIILLTPSSAGCEYSYPPRSCSTGPRLIGLPVIAVGLTTGILGKIKAHDADGEVNALIARGPGREPEKSIDVAVPAGGGRSLGLTLGSTKSLTYRLTW